MKFTYFLLILLVFLGFSSCISTKQLTYLQEDGVQMDSLIPIKKQQEPYRLQINDLISIRIKAVDQQLMSMFNPVGEEANAGASGEERLYYDGFRVDTHGKIRVPTLGEIAVLGYTVEEVREILEKKLNDDYLKEAARVFVTVKLSGIRYTINGEIASPGSNIIYRDQATIMEAIANSGDITVTGDRTNVIIIRQYPLGQKVHHIDLTRIDAMNSPYYNVQPNDLILINPLPQKSIGFGTTGLQSFTTILSIVTALTTAILLFVTL